MLSAHTDETNILKAINAGARGYLIKYSSLGTVCQAIREVHNGKTLFSAYIPNRLQKHSH